MKSKGQIAYEAYCDAVKWVSVRGEVLPDWECQALKIQLAWEAAAQAVIKATPDSVRLNHAAKGEPI